MPILEWKWENMSMDSVNEVPMSGGRNEIWVVVDRLIKNV